MLGRTHNPTVAMKGVVLWNGTHSRPLPPYYPGRRLLGEDALEPPWRAGSSRVSGPESLQLKVWRAVTSVLACWLRRVLLSELASCVHFLLSGFGFHIFFSFPNLIRLFLS